MFSPSNIQVISICVQVCNWWPKQKLTTMAQRERNRRSTVVFLCSSIISQRTQKKSNNCSSKTTNSVLWNKQLNKEKTLWEQNCLKCPKQARQVANTNDGVPELGCIDMQFTDCNPSIQDHMPLIRFSQYNVRPDETRNTSSPQKRECSRLLTQDNVRPDEPSNLSSYIKENDPDCSHSITCPQTRRLISAHNKNWMFEG